MSANQACFGVATMARVLGVSTSGYYAWRQPPPSARAQADADLTVRVRAIHTDSRETYGAPRFHAELAEASVAVGRKRVARVIGAAGIAGVSRHRGPRTTRRDVQARPAPDPVERDFEADAPNRLRVADITSPRLVGFLYLGIVLDVFSRRVVGWAMATHLRTELVVEALEMAVEQRRPRSGRPSLRPGPPVHVAGLRCPLPGMVPYGYRRIPRRDGVLAHVEVSEPEAQVVRQIFRWHVDERLSVRQIALRLTESAHVTATGLPRWGTSTVTRMLHTAGGQPDFKLDSTVKMVPAQGVYSGTVVVGRRMPPLYLIAPRHAGNRLLDYGLLSEDREIVTGPNAVPTSQLYNYTTTPHKQAYRCSPERNPMMLL